MSWGLSETLLGQCQVSWGQLGTVLGTLSSELGSVRVFLDSVK